ncbi:hypothetical protein AWC27_28705 [Mycobacterium szulgai]|uniref:Uncharacterized protein n=1 Tax=Mycobacterium szulgai TaxID=1787 RepID=A0A1X2EI50_MYCSZ|nr:hypothetical protein AWC27_28705 [Mycobacterium szulgai]
MLGINGTRGDTGGTASVDSLPPAIRPYAPFIANAIANSPEIGSALPTTDYGYPIIAGLEDVGRELGAKLADFPLPGSRP